MQHFSIKECSSKLQGDFNVQQFSRFCSQKISKWQQESNQFVAKNFNQNLKSELKSHIPVIHSIFSVVLLWQAV